MNDKESNIEQFSEPPKIVATKDIRVCILEMPSLTGTICTFLYAFPYLEEEGGLVRVFNPSYSPTLRFQQSHANKFSLWRQFRAVKTKALRTNSQLKVLYDGPILRDDYVKS